MKPHILTRALGVYVCLGAILTAFTGFGMHMQRWDPWVAIEYLLSFLMLTSRWTAVGFVAWFFWLGLRIAWSGRSLGLYVASEGILAVPSISIYVLLLMFPTAHFTPFPSETRAMFGTYALVHLLPMAVGAYCWRVQRKLARPPYRALRIVLVVISLLIAGGGLWLHMAKLYRLAKARGQTQALLDAARWSRLEEITLLIERNPGRVNERGDAGETPLSNAVGAAPASEALVKYLLGRGADINAYDLSGVTPLHVAARQGEDVILLLLLAHGADPNAFFPNHYAKSTTPLDQAVENNRPRAAELLIAHGARMSVFHAAALGKTAALRKFLDDDPSLAKQANDGGMTLLHWAALRNQAAAARLLLERGADPRAADPYGHTPADLARQEGNRQVLSVLGEGTAPGSPPDTARTSGTSQQKSSMPVEGASEVSRYAKMGRVRISMLGDLMDDSLKGTHYVNRLGSFALTVPIDWERKPQLHAEAGDAFTILGSRDNLRFLLVTQDSSVGRSLESYKGWVEMQVRGDLRDYEKLSELAVTIDGRPAVLLSYRGSSPQAANLSAQFLVGIIAHEVEFVTVTAWCAEPLFNKSQRTFETIILSYRKLRD